MYFLQSAAVNGEVFRSYIYKACCDDLCRMVEDVNMTNSGFEKRFYKRGKARKNRSFLIQSDLFRGGSIAGRTAKDRRWFDFPHRLL